MRGRRGASEEELARWSETETKHLWSALEKLPCPALVVRGAASDVLSADVADKMADEVLKNGKLEVIARAGHSVMLDNPEAFEKALSASSWATRVARSRANARRHRCAHRRRCRT